MPFHRGSLFCEGPRHPLSAASRAIWRARVELERRAGRLTALHAVVARALLRNLSEDGRCDPSHQHLAAAAGCSVSTVVRALAAMRDCGLVSWERRLIRRPWPAGGKGASRAEQTSNAYLLSMPQQAPALPADRRVALKNLSKEDSTSSLKVAATTAAFDPAARKALERIATARAARLGRDWSARHAVEWSRGM